MAKRLTDLQVKIGADGSGLEAALKKAKNEKASAREGDEGMVPFIPGFVSKETL